MEAISGACMLARREAFEKAGMFSDDYFMYSEDLDLCYQTVRVGFRNYYVGQGMIIHYGGRSSSPAWQTVMKTKAELYFCDKNYGRFYGAAFRAALVLNAIARLAMVGLLRVFSNKDLREKGRLIAASRPGGGPLRTILSPGSASTAQPAQPSGISGCGVANI